jgi:uncharacterized protein (DUF427 family)
MNFFRPKPITPGPGQESVWDYPRPAKLEETDKHLQIIFSGITLADTRNGKRVLETSHPPTYYIPGDDIRLEYLVETARRSVCEWKGVCVYYDVVVGDKKAPFGAWRYIQPTPNFVEIRDCYSFYASLMDECYVGDELVRAQTGDFYGGWITKDIVGPFKGGAGTIGW